MESNLDGFESVFLLVCLVSSWADGVLILGRSLAYTYIWKCIQMYRFFYVGIRSLDYMIIGCQVG